MITKEEAKKKYGNINPNQKNNFINWDALDALPEELEPVFTEIKFDPKKKDEYFTNVGTKDKPSWYPRTEMMYKIAEACGISGNNEKMVELIQENVDINPVLMKPFGTEPTMRNIKTAARVTKQSRVLCEDGTYRTCSPESNEFNFFTRACLDFLTEEEYTKSYTKKQEYYKYDTTIKRQKRLLELEKFAVQQAETKAFCKTIRVLAGLPTGFSNEDLAEGKLVFMKFVKSKRLQKLETAAKIDAIRNGRTGEIENISENLFGSNQIEAPIQEQQPEGNAFVEQDPIKSEPVIDDKTKIINTLKQYANEQESEILKINGAMDYLQTAIIKSENATIEQLKEVLRKIERKIPTLKKIDHKIDLSENNGEVF